MQRATPVATAPVPVASTSRVARSVRGRTSTELSFARTLAKLGVSSPKTGASPSTLAPAAAPATSSPAGRRAPQDPRETRDELAERPARESASIEPEWAHRVALLGPPPGELQPTAQAHVEQVSRHASLEELAPTLLRKMAWSGDGRKGAARLELGEGALSGAVVMLEADHGVVALSVDGLSAAEESKLRTRLAAGLEARGFRLAP